MTAPPPYEPPAARPPYEPPAARPPYEPPPAYGPPAEPGPVYPYPADGPQVPAPNPYPPYPYPYPYRYPAYLPRPTNAMAVASLVCAFVIAPLGVVFGHISLGQIKRSGEQGRGMAIAGLVIGYLITIVTVVALVAGFLIFSWAVKAVRESESGGFGIPGYRGTIGTGTLPPFQPPPGLGGTCTYPAVTTGPAPKQVRPPRSGKVPTQPAVVEATVTTDDGKIGLRLDNAKAPCTVNSFVSLAQQGFFNDTGCHRLTTSPALGVLQCGDPTGTGGGGPGYRFANEYPTNQYRAFDPELKQPVTYPRGTLAMANSGPDSNGSQFFIVYRDSMLPPTYTAFGTVDAAGLATVERVAAGGVTGGASDGKPLRPIRIQSIRLN